MDRIWIFVYINCVIPMSLAFANLDPFERQHFKVIPVNERNYLGLRVDMFINFTY